MSIVEKKGEFCNESSIVKILKTKFIKYTQFDCFDVEIVEIIIP